MRLSVLLLVILLTFHVVVLSPDSLYAEEMLSLEIDDTPAGKVVFHYNPKLVEIIAEEIPNQSGIEEVNIAKVRVSEKSNNIYLVKYTAGESVDPGFIVYEVLASGERKISEIVDGLNLAIPGDKYLYIWGHTNSYFNVRRKFEIINDMLKEVEQPFYYVGLRGNALIDIDIYKSKNKVDLVATIKKGTPLTIILNSGDFYLIKTESDILGWWNPKSMSYFTAEEIEGFFMLGD